MEDVTVESLSLSGDLSFLRAMFLTPREGLGDRRLLLAHLSRPPFHNLTVANYTRGHHELEDPWVGRILLCELLWESSFRALRR